MIADEEHVRLQGVRGDCQREFAEAAAEDGIELQPQSFSWLCQQGHLALPDEARKAADLLERIYLALGGDLDVLATARRTRLPGDFVHEPTGTLIEIDESQHFTSARLTALDLYPDDVALGFDLDHYKALCRKWRQASDGYYRKKAAPGFGVGGRQRQRAYYDALRDLAAPSMGQPPVIRIDVPLREGRVAYRTRRERLVRLANETAPDDLVSLGN
ncbi:MAG: hypothetical protein H0V79_02420 [Actinobacteria bacterium]|nr:hypothetical protein [Actinomycetota bacterium]